MIVALTTHNQRITQGDFVAPSFEKNAQDGAPKNNKTTQIEIQTADGSYTAQILKKLKVLEDDNLRVCFANDKSNDVWLRLRIFDGEQIIAESGILQPFQFIENIKMTSTPIGNSVVVKIMAYEPQTYYSVGSTEIVVNIIR